MNEDINDFNLHSIKGKKSPVQNGDTFISNQKDIKNLNIKFNMNPIFEPQQTGDQENINNNNNMKINTNESIKINSSAINNKYGVKYMLIPQTN